jgi:hypothetical protein
VLNEALVAGLFVMELEYVIAGALCSCQANSFAFFTRFGNGILFKNTLGFDVSVVVSFLFLFFVDFFR